MRAAILLYSLQVPGRELNRSRLSMQVQLSELSTETIKDGHEFHDEFGKMF